jgi:hypothetical protein
MIANTTFKPELISLDLSKGEASIVFGRYQLDFYYGYTNNGEYHYCLVYNRHTQGSLLVDEELTAGYGFRECIDYYLHILEHDPIPFLQLVKQDISTYWEVG